jgi:D-alanine-D-alanine ligase
MIVEAGEPYVLEANTLPGMTKNSLIPKSAAAVGISFEQLLDIIIEQSLKERG